MCVLQRDLPYVSDHPAQREETNPTHTHTEGIKRLTLAAPRAAVTLREKNPQARRRTSETFIQPELPPHQSD